MKKIILVLLVLTFSLNAEELTLKSYGEGLKTSFTYLYQGSYLQFKEKNNAYYAIAAVPMLWYSFDQDKRISNLERSKSISKPIQLSGDLAPLLGFPLISFATYSYGIKHEDQKMVRFAEEYFASMYLAFLESAAMSLVYVHERPNTSKLSGWETNFRGKSSFPSGHVIPYATLMFKSYQFYGPAYAVIPAGLFVMTSIQRIRDGKHYLSDIVGGFFLSAFASEGVRRASGYSENHQSYKKIFERNFDLGILEYEGTIGPRITFYLD